jgi:transcriptional/translational regulatory protein YebC/TACO1
MPKENVQRAIDRGLGVGKTGRIEEVLYEGYGPGGVGLLVNAHTDNRQRTGSEIRFTFDKYGGNLGSPGSVAYLFERVGRDFIVKIPLTVDEQTKAQVDALVEHLEELDDVEEVIDNLSASDE